MIFKIEITKCQWTEKGYIKEILLDEGAQSKIWNIMQPTYKLKKKT